MKYLPYIVKHLRKNWIRTTSTIAAMALCIFLISVLQTALQAFYGGLDTASRERLVTRNRLSLVNPVPVSYGPRIQAIPGVRRVAKFCWFGGVMGYSGGQPDFQNFFPNFAVEAEPYLAMYPEYIVPPDQLRDFMQDRRGAIIGPGLVEKFGWQIGSTFQLESIIPPYRTGRPFEFVVRAIYDTDRDKYPNHPRDIMLFHWEYLYESTGQRSGVGTYNVQVTNPDQLTAVAKAIDETFENSDVQTKTETEAQFIASFLALAGDLALILNSIGMAVAFTILLVTANTMSMAIRERRTEIAVLKTLGYSSRLVLALILGEAVVIGAVGGGLGVLLARGLIANLVNIPGIGTMLAQFPPLTLSPGLAAGMLGFGALIGLMSGLAPALGAYRASITSMLRQV
ncbi:MAG TPA: FtsX-like permease family protein [Vicinamibacterales bacterium]|nr:FtsX-like permease family protein [Vicinamibacterales bacterium]